MRSSENDSLRQASTAATTQRWLVMAAVVGAAVVVGPPDAVDGIMVAKAVLVFVAAIVALAIAAGAGARAARVGVARDPAILAAGLFAFVFLVMTVLSADPARSVAGAVPRWTGAGMYLACTALFVVAATRFTRVAVVSALRAVAVTAAFLAALAAAEALELVQFGGPAVSGARATLGNPNFLAGWLAISVPLSAVLALDERASPDWRRVGAAAALGGLVGAALTLSLQGVAGAAVGLAVLGLVWMGSRFPARQVRMAAAAIVAVGGVVLTIGVLGAQGSGPLSALGDEVGIEHRGYYWRAAVSMVADEPLTGVGPARFGDQYRRHRPVEDALESPLEDVGDAAHSVPLELAAGGGIPLVLAYAAWVGVVGWRLWRGLATMEGRDRMLLGGVGAAWAAYLAQSFVSIDVAPLAVFGWVLGGLVVALGGDRRTWQLSLPRPPQRRRGGTAGHVWAADAVTVVVAGVLVWLALLPLRADAGATQAAKTAAGGLAAESGVNQAAELAGWEPAYGMQLVRAHLALGDLTTALLVATELVERSPDSLDAVLTAARLAAETGDAELAEELYEGALVLEPVHPELALEVAEFAESQGDTAWARRLVAGVLALDPGHSEAVVFQEQL